jgi:CRP-like cAMP-binding protein/thioredoxin reductase
VGAGGGVPSGVDGRGEAVVMAERFEVAIIGSGPGGLSAGGRAAALGLSHVVLEREKRHAETIQKYQRGKLVMATPDFLPLRSDMSFAEGSRETILDTWDRELAERRVNVRYGADVAKITGTKGAFKIVLRNGETIEAANVVLAIGLQGNLNRLTVPGSDLPFVQYQLDDPAAYFDEDIIVVGASDSAIENAVALAGKDRANRVVLVNRGAEFARAKTRNASIIRSAIRSGSIDCAYMSETDRIEPGLIHLKTAEGSRAYPCDRVIARLGGKPPNDFLKSCGIRVPEGAYPEVSEAYETSVPGLYAIGALVGYPLIKQCMNQGYEVISAIAGQRVPPADEPLLVEKLLEMPGRPSVSEALALIRSGVRLFRGLKTLQLRDLLLDGETRAVLAGETIYRHKEFDDTLFMIVSGTIEIERTDDNDPAAAPRLTTRGEGEFFGEAGLIANRPRLGTARARTDCVVIELARRAALKLLASQEDARDEFGRITILRQMQEDLLPDLSEADLEPLVATAQLKRLKPNETLVKEGDADDGAAYLIRSGSVTISRKVDGKEKVLSYEPAGRLIGEMALLRDAPRAATVTAAIATEAIRLDGTVFRQLVDGRPDLRAKIDKLVQSRLEGAARAESDTGRTGIAGFFARTEVGLAEATDVLLIDESLCIRCDNCEKACAESHDGISRLNREAGPTFAMLHVPTSCRHCEHPHCMKDCPPDAIHRATNGEVWIDPVTCIGCENCKDNCPYGVIQMATKPPEKPGLLSWLFFGMGSGPGEDKAAKARHLHHADDGQGDGAKAPPKKKAVKCDMCKGIDGGAACVRACPTGAAIRVSPEEYLNATVDRQ